MSCTAKWTRATDDGGQGATDLWIGYVSISDIGTEPCTVNG